MNTAFESWKELDRSKILKIKELSDYFPRNEKEPYPEKQKKPFADVLQYMCS